MELAAQRLEQGQKVRPSFFTDAAEFIKGFADGCHHRKEECVLFKTMVDCGMPADTGPIAAMMHEHEEDRTYARGMREAAQRLSKGNESARAEVIRNARGYAELLRQHIVKKDYVLSPTADQVIPPSKHHKVFEDFRHIEHDETGGGVHEKYLALAEKLETEIKGSP